MAAVKKSSSYQQFKAVLQSGSFGRMYILHGDEPFLVESCRRELRKKLIPSPTEDFNYHRFTQENWSLDAFSEAIEALPMMSEHSLVEVLDIDFFSFSEHDRTQMAEIFSDLPSYCTVLFLYDTVEWKPDKRMKKLYGAMESVCSVFALNKQSEQVLIPWIRKQLSRDGKTISDELCRHLILQTGGAMTSLSTELQKLSLYTDQPEIRKSDIDDVVIPVLEAAIFDITKDIGAKNFDRALARLSNLLQQNTEPIAINAVIGRQFRQMYAAKLLSAQGKGAYDLCMLYGIRDFAAREIFGQAQGYKKEQLKAGMQFSAETDLAMKTSIADSEALLRDMLLELGQMEVPR